MYDVRLVSRYVPWSLPSTNSILLLVPLWSSVVMWTRLLSIRCYYPRNCELRTSWTWGRWSRKTVLRYSTWVAHTSGSVSVQLIISCGCLQEAHGLQKNLLRKHACCVKGDENK
uniref:Uncharacterized protein n=1 Tax=Rhipicephalus zambeziensis TaxID=60191 RepID=A0A224YAP4_9ACAR